MDRDVIGTCSPSIFVDVWEEVVVGLGRCCQGFKCFGGSRRDVPT